MIEPRLVSWYYRRRAAWWRLIRLWFPSPAELKLVKLLGGKVLSIGFIKYPNTGFPLALIYKRPRLFKDEHVRREVRCGKYFVDFGNDVGRAIEIDGAAFHRDVVAEFDREAYLITRHWRILHIDAVKVYREPAKTKELVISFLSS